MKKVLIKKKCVYDIFFLFPVPLGTDRHTNIKKAETKINPAQVFLPKTAFENIHFSIVALNTLVNNMRSSNSCNLHSYIIIWMTTQKGVEVCCDAHAARQRSLFLSNLVFYTMWVTTFRPAGFKKTISAPSASTRVHTVNSEKRKRETKIHLLAFFGVHGLLCLRLLNGYFPGNRPTRVIFMCIKVKLIESRVQIHGHTFIGAHKRSNAKVKLAMFAKLTDYPSSRHKELYTTKLYQSGDHLVLGPARASTISPYRAIKILSFLEFLSYQSCNMVLPFESVGEILKCDHPNESYWPVRSCGVVCCPVQGGSNFSVSEWNFTVWPLGHLKESLRALLSNSTVCVSLFSQIFSWISQILGASGCYALVIGFPEGWDPVLIWGLWQTCISKTLYSPTCGVLFSSKVPSTNREASTQQD